MSCIIRAEELSKKYIIGHEPGGAYNTLRDEIAQRARMLARKVLRPGRRRDGAGTEYEEFWALRDVSFEVQEGDRLGIIGRNGAGKSTLLKILSRITEPTRGRVAIRGRVASLLEVGTGFHPELSGRENIFLNGAVLGMRRAEIARKFDEIVAFAEIEKFLDTPVKRYSSGMYVRLAFAVAAHLEPEILIVDEVLAVGDIKFQKKCLGKMDEIGRHGRTVLFVSHNMAAIKSLCASGVVLDRGAVSFAGTADQCVAAYNTQNTEAKGARWRRNDPQPDNALVFVEVEARLTGTQPRLALELDIALESTGAHKPAFLAIDVLDSGGTAVLQAIPELRGFLSASERHHSVRVHIDLPPLIPGLYLVTVWVGSHNSETLDQAREIVAFEVHESPTPGRTFPHTTDHGYVVPSSTVQSLGVGPTIE